MQAALLERAMDAACAGGGIFARIHSHRDPGAAARRAGHRCVPGCRFVIPGMKRCIRNRDGDLAVLELNREPLRSSHVVLGEARWSGVVVFDVENQHCYTVLVWIP